MHYFFEPSEEAASAAMQATTDHARWMQTDEFKRRDAELTKRIAELTAKRDAGELYSTAPSTFTFSLSLSEKPYADKNSIPWGAVHYKRVNLTINQFAEYIKQGYTFTSIFNTPNFIVKQKTDPNWIASQFVVFDVDNVFNETTLQEYLSEVQMKPTIAYTSRNHGFIKEKQNKPFSRFRLVYVFRDYFQSKEVYQSIYTALKANLPTVYTDPEGKDDDCGKSPVQQFAGNTYSNLEMTVNENCIYSVSSFPTEPNKPTPEPSKPTEPTEPSKPTEPSTEPNLLNDTFFKDLNSMKPVNFFRKYVNAYGIIEKPEIVYENGFYETTEDYVEIMRKYRKVYDAETQNYKTKRQRIHSGERHSTLFAYAKLRCQIKPEITLEELVFNSVYDRTYFCDNEDKEITNECLIDICRAAKQANYTMKMKNRPKFKIDKTFCIANNINPCAFRQQIRRKLNFDSIDAWYDSTKSVKENLIFAENNNIKVKKDTLYSYCKARAISTKGTKPAEPQNPSPEQPPEPQKPSAEPSEALEHKEAIQSAPEPQKPSAKILEFIDFSEYRKKCKLYQTIFGNRTTNKNLTLYNYDRKQEEAASF